MPKSSPDQLIIPTPHWQGSAHSLSSNLKPSMLAIVVFRNTRKISAAVGSPL